MTEFDKKLEITNFLNNNGFDEVTVDSRTSGTRAVVSPRCTDCDFTVRLGYWDMLPHKLWEEMELEFSVRIEEHVIEDEDCGELYCYEFTVVDPDTGYTLNELNELESNYSDESDYLMAVGAGGEWGVA